MRRALPAAPLVTPLLLALLAGGAPLAAQSSAPDGATVVYLVRHAERAEDGTGDPAISNEGRARAALLAELLRDAGITHVHTTDYRRTRQTAAPIADALGLEPQVYDARDLAALAARIRATPGRHLVVGHSNTTPQAVAALGGEGGAPIEDLEYDRLYVLVLGPEGPTTTVLLHFGVPWRLRPAPAPPRP